MLKGTSNTLISLIAAEILKGLQASGFMVWDIQYFDFYRQLGQETGKSQQAEIRNER